MAGRIELAVLRGLVALFLIGALVTPYIAGAVGAYVIVFLAIILATWQYLRPVATPADPAAVMLLAAFCAVAIAFAITARPGSTDGLYALNFVLFALFAPLLGAVSRLANPRNTATVASLALAGSLLANIVAAVQVTVYNMPRAEGWGSNPIPSSTAALFLGFFALMGYLAVKNWRRNIFLLGPIFGIGTVFLAGSRGPLVALLPLVIVALFLVRIRWPVLVSVTALVAAGSTGFFLARPDVLQRFLILQRAALDIAVGTPVDADISTAIRYRIFQGSVAAFEQSPWIGYGWYGKIPAVRRFVDVFPDNIYSHLHSDILNFGVSAGIVGLFAYLLVLLAPIVSVWRSPKDSQFEARAYGATALSVGYLFCGAVNLLFGFEYMTTFYIAIAVVFLGYCRDAQPERPAPVQAAVPSNEEEVLRRPDKRLPERVA